MVKYFSVLVVLLLVGGGCVKMTQTPHSPFQLQDVAFPSGAWQFANTDEYALPVDYSFTLEQQGDDVHISNFVRSDDYSTQYPANAFSVQVNAVDLTREEFAKSYTSTQLVTLADEQVILGNERLMSGETWPGHAYYNEQRGVLISLYYAHEEGGEIADAIVQQIRWQERE